MVPAPAGYVRFAAGGAEVVARAEHADAVREAVRGGTLYEWAERHPSARGFAGRGVAWAALLPDGRTRIVVRHSRHGGLLARLTGDRFLAPTRAPRELAAALRLAAAGVPTPEVVAYATYAAGPGFRRADVATREIPSGRDLAWVLTNPPDAEALARNVHAVHQLLVRLYECGARHPDLNVKNVLLAPYDAPEPVAYVLDVDRVVFDAPRARAVWHANVRRLVRSWTKWRERHGALVDVAPFEAPWAPEPGAMAGR